MHIVEQKGMKLPVFLVIWLFSYIALQIKISIVLYFTLKTKQHCVVVTLEEDFSIVYFAIISAAEDLKSYLSNFVQVKLALLNYI